MSTETSREAQVPPAGAMVLPPTVLGPSAAASALASGEAEVFCLLPDDYLQVGRRRIAWIYIDRALRRAGLSGASIWWAWYREDENGDPETVFRVTARRPVMRQAA